MNLVGRVLLPLVPLVVIGALAAPRASAQEVYVTGEIAALSPSDETISKVYGVMPEFRLGVGLESNGFGGELDLVGSFKEGTPVNITDTPGLSMNSRITNLSVVARASRTFGKRGEGVRPYFGIQGSYDSVTETLTATLNGQDQGSVSASANGWGYGVFAGVDFSLTRNLTLQLEGRYTHNNVEAQIDSNSGNGSAFAKSGVNTRGLSGGVAIKYFF